MRSVRDSLHLKKFQFSLYDLFAFALVIIATSFRFLLISSQWPITNSDEGNMGVLALHVAYNGEWPIFFYGLPYMGPIEGYLAASLFHLLGPSLFSLRLGLLWFYPLFLLCMYYLTCRLYRREYALFIVLLLSVGSDETILRQVKAVGEYPETIFFAALISLLAVWIAQTEASVPPQQRTTWRRVRVYALLGFVIGLAFWVDMLILPVVGASLLLLLLFCWRELRSRAGIGTLIGMLIGGFPLVIYNATAPLDQSSLVVLYNLQHSNGDRSHTFLQQLLGTIGISIPDVMNFNPLCINEVQALIDGKQVACAAAQFSWGIGFFLLYGIALVTTGLVAWRSWRWHKAQQGQDLEEQEATLQRKFMIRSFCRLMLLVSAGGTILAYVTSPNPATVPAPTARYLTCLLIALPALLWPLWNGFTHWSGEIYQSMLKHRFAASLQSGAHPTQPLTSSPIEKSGEMTLRTIGSFVSGIVQGSVLLLFLSMSIVGTYRTFQQIPDAQRFYASQERLIQHLQAIHATHFYTEYWTCNRLIFQSREKLICSSLDEKLAPGFDRYQPYRTIVKATKDPAYIFPQNAPQVALMDARLQDHSLQQAYQRQEFENYVIYYVPHQEHV